MKNPRDLTVYIEGASYGLPAYGVFEDGLQDTGTMLLDFVKGSKDDPNVYSQYGVLTESVIEACIQYLRSVNVAELASRETSVAITKLEEAQMWLQRRAEDRKLRGVQNTYKP